MYWTDVCLSIILPFWLLAHLAICQFISLFIYMYMYILIVLSVSFWASLSVWYLFSHLAILLICFGQSFRYTCIHPECLPQFCLSLSLLLKSHLLLFKIQPIVTKEKFHQFNRSLRRQSYTMSWIHQSIRNEHPHTQDKTQDGYGEKPL